MAAATGLNHINVLCCPVCLFVRVIRSLETKHPAQARGLAGFASTSKCSTFGYNTITLAPTLARS